jgi:hypothetical protein
MAQVSNKKIIGAIMRHRGLLAPAAESIGIARSTIYDRAKKSEAIRTAIDEARETMIDKAESKLFESVEARDAWAVQFYLKTQAKNRGYVERSELTGADGGPVDVTQSVVFGGKKIEF